MIRGHQKLGISVALLLLGGCKTKQSDSDAIRAGIMRHLNGVGTLDMTAMDMDLKSASVNGSQAHAEVEFRPKTGAPPGAGMQVAYNLEKRDGAWVVLRTQAAGGTIQHPAPGQNPHQNQNVHAGQLPDLSELLKPAGPPAHGTLPPGHPAIAARPDKTDPLLAEKQR
jgi:hypothetical protein